jgi:hypothetical protein
MKRPEFKCEYKKPRDEAEPVNYKSFDEMPYLPACTAYTTWNKTGSWRYLRPNYVERIPPCQSSCPTGNDIEHWIR